MNPAQMLATLVMLGACTQAEADEAHKIIGSQVYAVSVDGWLSLVRDALQVVRDRRHQRYQDLQTAIVEDELAARRRQHALDLELEHGDVVQFAPDRQSAIVRIAGLGGWSVIRLTRRGVPVLAGLRMSARERDAVLCTLTELGTPIPPLWIEQVLNTRVPPERQEQPAPRRAVRYSA